MRSFIPVFYSLFGLLTIVGGIIGYTSKHSVASLVAGGILGALLVAAAFTVHSRLHIGLCLGLIASIAIAGKFVPDFITKHGLFPAGIMALLSVASLILTIATWYHR